MSRLFFISFNQCRHPYEVYPLGMAVVAAAMKRLGHDVYLYDVPMEENRGNGDAMIATIQAFAPDYICVSLRNLDDEIDSGYDVPNGDKYAAIGECIRKFKAAVEATVILGGAAFSLSPLELLELTGGDYGIVGEGEVALGRLLGDLQASRPTERILSGNGSLLPENDVKGALYCPDLVRWYYQRSDFIGIQSKRGCPFRCAYCTYPGLEGRRFRYRPVEEVIGEIEQLRNDYGCRNFFFTDSVFNDPAGRYKELVEAIVRNALDIQWSAYFTPYRLNKSDIDLCVRAGLYAVELGTDASNSTALAGLNKMFEWSDVVSANENVTSAGLACAHFVIFGGPDETYKTVEEGIQNCRRLDNCVVFGYTGVRVYPGSPIFERAVSEGAIEPDTSLLEPYYYFSSDVDKETINNMIAKGWSRSRRLIFPPEKARSISDFLRTNFNTKGLIWDQMCRM